MARTDNDVIINAPMALVWRLTNDLARWPDLFTEYAAVEVLESSPRGILFRLTTRPDEQGVVWSWVSLRRPDPDTRTVQSHRVETGPFQYMRIRWEYEAVGGAVRLRWLQDFAVKPETGLRDEDVTVRLNRTSAQQLAHIRDRVEQLAGQLPPAAGDQAVRAEARPEVRAEARPEIQPEETAHVRR
jgi:ribosome-associated toxin RatA of RatAB toxin-antitoxin module